MRLKDYLAQRNESQTSFATRVNVPRSTINQLCRDTYTGGATVSSAIRIMEGTGGLVTLYDLRPQDERVA